MESAGVFTHTKSLPFWMDPNLCAPRTTWQSWRRFWTKLTSSKLLVEKNENKTQVLQFDKPKCVCCCTQRRTYGLQGRCFNWTSAEKSHNQLFHFWRKYKTALKGQRVLFGALALHLHAKQKLKEETSKTFTSFIKKMVGLRSNQFLGVHMNDNPFVEDLLLLHILSKIWILNRGTLLENLL